jgi:hypothetical protein
VRRWLSDRQRILWCMASYTRQEQREYIFERRAIFNERGLCADCGRRPYAKGKKRCTKCLTTMRERVCIYRVHKAASQVV